MILDRVQVGVNMCMGMQTASDEEKRSLLALLAQLQKRDCDKRWLLTLLWCLNPSDPLFSKGYYYQKPINTQVKFMPLIPNE